MLANLNKNEIIVLKGLVKEMKKSTGGEFGFISEVKHPFTRHQFAGYISDLVKKGFFEYLEQTDEVYAGQFAILDEIYNEVVRYL